MNDACKPTPRNRISHTSVSARKATLDIDQVRSLCLSGEGKVCGVRDGGSAPPQTDCGVVELVEATVDWKMDVQNPEAVEEAADAGAAVPAGVTKESNDMLLDVPVNKAIIHTDRWPKAR